MKMKPFVAKISELILDEDIYPRMKVGWLTAYQYAQAIVSGSVFPPIIVGKFQDKLYVVDGWHRIQARKYLKEEYIEALIREFDSKEDMFVQAVILNSPHGRQLSVQEKVRIIDKLTKMDFEPERISEIIHIPVDKISMFQVRTIIGPDGKPVYLKSPIARLKENAKKISGIDMSPFNVRNTVQLLTQLNELLNSDVYPFEDPVVKELTLELYVSLQEKLELV